MLVSVMNKMGDNDEPKIESSLFDNLIRAS